MTAIRAACVGAGARAYSAHYPCLAQLNAEVTIAACAGYIPHPAVGRPK